MRDLWLRVGGTLLIATIAYLLLLGVQQGLKPFDYAVFPIEDSLASGEKEIAQGVSYALWGQRSLDLIILALLFFAASACCASILGSEKDARVERV